MGHGSWVTYIVPSTRQFPSWRLAILNASTSACAVGSALACRRLCPRAMISPSSTMTAPTGTSPPAPAARASSSAARMKESSQTGMERHHLFRSDSSIIASGTASGLIGLGLASAPRGGSESCRQPRIRAGNAHSGSKRTRTSNPRFRRPMLYPLSYGSSILTTRDEDTEFSMRPSPRAPTGLPPIARSISNSRGTLYHFSVSSPSSIPKKRRRGRDSNPRSRFIPTRRFSKPVPSANSATSPGFASPGIVTLASRCPDVIATSFQRHTSLAVRHARHPADDTSSRLFSFHQPGGGGGIRTPGAFTRRFSRPLPSTTRPLLRVPGGKTRGSIE
jgi:hypothetical protein